jgi:hypothetical protein
MRYRAPCWFAGSRRAVTASLHSSARSCTLSGAQALGLETLQFVPGPRLENETFARAQTQRLDFAIEYGTQGVKFLWCLWPLALADDFCSTHRTMALYDGNGKRRVSSFTFPRISSRPAVSSRRFRASLMRSAMSSISSSFMPRVVTAGVPTRMPPGLKMG